MRAVAAEAPTRVKRSFFSSLVLKAAGVLFHVNQCLRYFAVPYGVAVATSGLVLKGEPISASTLLLNGLSVVFVTEVDEMLEVGRTSETRNLLEGSNSQRNPRRLLRNARPGL